MTLKTIDAPRAPASRCRPDFVEGLSVRRAERRVPRKAPSWLRHARGSLRPRLNARAHVGTPDMSRRESLHRAGVAPLPPPACSSAQQGYARMLPATAQSIAVTTMALERGDWLDAGPSMASTVVLRTAPAGTIRAAGTHCSPWGGSFRSRPSPASHFASEIVAFRQRASFVLHGGLVVKLPPQSPDPAGQFRLPRGAFSTPSSPEQAKPSGCRSTPRPRCGVAGGSAMETSEAAIERAHTMPHTARSRGLQGHLPGRSFTRVRPR